MKKIKKLFFAFLDILLCNFLINYRQFVRVTFAELPVVGDHPIELILNIRGLRDHRRYVAQTGLQLTQLPAIKYHTSLFFTFSIQEGYNRLT